MSKDHTKLIMKKYFAFLPLIASCKGLFTSNDMNSEQGQCLSTSQSFTESDTKLSCCLDLKEKCLKSLIKRYDSIISHFRYKNQLNAWLDIMSHIKNNKIPNFDLDEKKLKNLKNESLTDMVTGEEIISNKCKRLFLSDMTKTITTKLLDHIEKKVNPVKSNGCFKKYPYPYDHQAYFNVLRKLCRKYFSEIDQQNLCKVVNEINEIDYDSLCDLINTVCAFGSYNIFNGMLDFFQEKSITLSYVDYGNFDSSIQNDPKYVESLMNHSAIFPHGDFEHFKRDIFYSTNNDDVLKLIGKRWPSAECVSALTKRGRIDIVLNLFYQGIIPEQELIIDEYKSHGHGHTCYNPYKISYLVTDVLDSYKEEINKNNGATKAVR